jgi:hypothetical protein
VTLENYDDTDYGYLRITVDPHQLRIEYHPASDADQSKTPDDSVTIDLASRKRTTYTPNDMGFPAQAEAIRQLHAQQSGAPSPAAHPASRPRTSRRRSQALANKDGVWGHRASWARDRKVSFGSVTGHRGCIKRATVQGGERRGYPIKHGRMLSMIRVCDCHHRKL